MKLFNYVAALFFLVVVLCGAICMGKVKTDFALLLPDTIQGWKVAAKDQIYNRNNLYDYIDGGAELYLSYGFHNVVNRTYVKSGQPDMVVDVFDMGDSQNAYGVFSHAREEEDTTFGQGSQYAAGLLLFWKDRYYISILTIPETVESKKAIFELARKIEKAIGKEGPLPEMLTLLPQQSLVKESIRYFRHYVWLNSYYFVADQNILHINEKTKALLAKYGEKKKRYLLLLVKYSSDKDAKHAYDDFAKYYLPELSQETVVKIEDGTWTACRLEKNLLIIVFNAPVKDKALHLIEAVQKRTR
ncbi:MAG: hypothetical protein KAJ08_12640 [Deltaproteobacteria bacterium]|nr:hypothetical protein [Deltaproteobacteria bacterium]